MSERLQELLRQRQLIQQHLAWLESEIARENELVGAKPLPLLSSRAGTGPSPFPSPAAPASAATPATASAPVSAVDADSILKQYEQDSVSSPADARKGCIAVFVGGMALLALAVLVAYFVWLQRHPQTP